MSRRASPIGLRRRWFVPASHRPRPIGGLSRNMCRLPRPSAIVYRTSLSPCLRHLTDKVRIISQRRNSSVLIDRSHGLRWRLVNFLTLAVGNIVLTIEKSWCILGAKPSKQLQRFSRRRDQTVNGKYYLLIPLIVCVIIIWSISESSNWAVIKCKNPTQFDQKFLRSCPDWRRDFASFELSRSDWCSGLSI